MDNENALSTLRSVNESPEGGNSHSQSPTKFKNSPERIEDGAFLPPIRKGTKNKFPLSLKQDIEGAGLRVL